MTAQNSYDEGGIWPQVGATLGTLGSNFYDSYFGSSSSGSSGFSTGGGSNTWSGGSLGAASEPGLCSKISKRRGMFLDLAEDGVHPGALLAR
jgi:hypothetical protein